MHLADPLADIGLIDIIGIRDIVFGAEFLQGLKIPLVV
jgi:hypothetical protein